MHRCFPKAEIALKAEPVFGKDKATVSWHADSTLDHFSTIGVYHFAEAKPENAQKDSDDWRIALRVWYDAEGPNNGKPTSRSAEMKSLFVAPPLSINLPNPCAYFLLDDFNHHHQHSGMCMYLMSDLY